MSGLFSRLIVIAGFFALLLLFLYVQFSENRRMKMLKAIPALTTVLAIWGLCTSWFWFYLFNLYLSLPALVLAILLNAFSTYKSLNPKLVRINSILILSAFVLGALSFVYFDV
tara:strand:- start:225 stop:563 length:339 start_codon:yes stop_codon:yes gene_type:complete